MIVLSHREFVWRYLGRMKLRYSSVYGFDCHLLRLVLRSKLSSDSWLPIRKLAGKDRLPNPLGDSFYRPPMCLDYAFEFERRGSNWFLIVVTALGKKEL